MIRIENTSVIGWEPAIRGMRNPMNSWDKSDTMFIHDGDYRTLNGDSGPYYGNNDDIEIGSNDLDLMLRLARAGSVDGKFRRMIAVYVDLTAPLYWWKEFETYRVGVTPNPVDIEMNSCSTMHKIHAREFTLDDFSCEHLASWGAALRGNPGGDLMEEKVSDFLYDYMGSLMATIVALNSAREQFLKRHDKQYWWQMIQLLPSSYNQKRTVMLNYEVLANIYRHRRNHKLDEWRELCKWIEELPYSEIITCNVTKEA